MAGFKKKESCLLLSKKSLSVLLQLVQTKGNYPKHSMISLNKDVFIMHFLSSEELKQYSRIFEHFLYETLLHQNGKLPKSAMAPKYYFYKS